MRGEHPEDDEDDSSEDAQDAAEIYGPVTRRVPFSFGARSIRSVNHDRSSSSGGLSPSAPFDHFVNSVPMLCYASSDSSCSHDSMSDTKSPRTPADGPIFPTASSGKRAKTSVGSGHDWSLSLDQPIINNTVDQWEDSSNDSFVEAFSRPQSRLSSCGTAHSEEAHSGFSAATPSDDESLSKVSQSVMATPRAVFPPTPRMGDTVEILDPTTQSSLFGGYAWTSSVDESCDASIMEKVAPMLASFTHSERPVPAHSVDSPVLNQRRPSLTAAPPPRPCKSPRRRPPPLSE